MNKTPIKERRPRSLPGSIHCPVRQMHSLIDCKSVAQIEHMIRQLRAAYADPTRSDYEKAGYLWLGRRYAKAFKDLTGKDLPK